MVSKAYSIEDGNLQTASIITSRVKVYKDLDLVFGNRLDGDVFKKTDAAAVKQSVKNILMTNQLEKPFSPDFGGDLNKFLFELADFFDAELIEDKVKNAIENFEQRARVLNVDAKILPDNNDVKVTVKFQVINISETLSIDVTISRLR